MTRRDVVKQRVRRTRQGGAFRFRQHLVLFVVLAIACLSMRPGISLAGSASSFQHTLNRATAKATSSPELFLPDQPSEAKHITPVLHHMIGLAQSSRETQDAVSWLRKEYDSVKSELTAVQNELQLVEQEREAVAARLTILSSEQQQRMAALRQELEVKFQEEIAGVRDHILAEQQREFAGRVQTFEIRQRDSLKRSLEQEVDLKDRQLQQLQQELDVHLQELRQGLARLNMGPEAASPLEQSTAEALIQQRSDLDARRIQLTAEHRELVAQHRASFIHQLEQQQEAELQQRVTFKEASMRSAMAGLLHKTGREEANKSARVQAQLDALTKRSDRLTRQQALLSTRAEAIDKKLTAQMSEVERLAGRRLAALADLEKAFEQVDLQVRPETLAWFGQSIQYLPSEVVPELMSLQQRMESAALKERRLEEQRRLMREQEKAERLARELEEQRQKLEMKRQQEQEAKEQKAALLLASAQKLFREGDFDEALALIAKAKALNPPQLQVLNAMHQEMLVTRERRIYEMKAAEIEELFGQAMRLFESGRYEEAAAFFEEVIEKEAAMGQPASTDGGGS